MLPFLIITVFISQIKGICDCTDYLDAYGCKNSNEDCYWSTSQNKCLAGNPDCSSLDVVTCKFPTCYYDTSQAKCVQYPGCSKIKGNVSTCKEWGCAASDATLSSSFCYAFTQCSQLTTAQACIGAFSPNTIQNDGFCVWKSTKTNISEVGTNDGPCILAKNCIDLPPYFCGSVPFCQYVNNKCSFINCTQQPTQARCQQPYCLWNAANSTCSTNDCSSYLDVTTCESTQNIDNCAWTSKNKCVTCTVFSFSQILTIISMGIMIFLAN